MAVQTKPEVVLYDLACTKNICFSPTVWRIRLMLSYKHIPYRTNFLEFPDTEPTPKGLGLVPGESASGSTAKYTVPAIHHVPTDTYMMDSNPIVQFLEATYPEPALPLTSELGREIEAKARAVGGATFRRSVMPREIGILSPRSQEYFRRTREASLGHRLEDLLDPEKEEEARNAVGEGLRAVGELMQTHKADGPFVLGARPSSTDFFIAGSSSLHEWWMRGCSRGISSILVIKRFMRPTLHGEEGLSGWNRRAGHRLRLVDGTEDSPAKIRRYN